MTASRSERPGAAQVAPNGDPMDQARIVIYSGCTFEQAVALIEAERKAEAKR